MNMKKSVLVSAVAVATAFAATAADKVATDGSVWRYRYYGDAAFTQYVGTRAYSNANFSVDLRLLPWPARGSDHGFMRDNWSFVARSEPVLAKAGDYRFRVNCPRQSQSSVFCKLVVNGIDVADSPDGQVTLPSGKALVEVFGRHGWPDNSMGARFSVEWQEPGETAWKLFKPTAASDATMALEAVRFDTEFKYDEGFNRINRFRSWTFTVPEDGIYELAYHCYQSPYDLKMRLDKLSLLNWRQNYSNCANRVTGDMFQGIVPGDRRIYPADFYGRVGRRKFLKKGEHVFDVMIHWRGDMKYFRNRMEVDRARVRFGVRRLDGRNARQDVAFYFDDRETMVLEKGEPLVVKAAAGSDRAGEYTMQVFTTRGKKLLWSETKKVGRTPVAFTYTPDKERGYEYRFVDAAGKVVEGPWSFCMCDPTPVARPKMAKGQDITTKGVTVDVCPCTEGEGGAHDFRDNGTSTIVKHPDGDYRLVGPSGPVTVPRYEQKDRQGTIYVLEEEGKPKPKGFNRWSQKMDWFAYTLHPKHPRKAHLLRCHVPNDMERVDAVLVIDPRTQTSEGGLLMTGQGPAAAKKPYLDLVVWPNSTDLYVVAVHTHAYHRSAANRRSAFASFELIELPDDLPLLPEAAAGWNKRLNFGWTGEQGDLWANERTMPPLFDDDDTTTQVPSGAGHRQMRWDDFLCVFERFMRYSAWRGDSEICVPVLSYNMLYADGEPIWEVGGGFDVYHGGELDDRTDLFHRDVFRVMLMKANKYGVKLVADFSRAISQEMAACYATNQGDPAGAEHVFFKKEDGKVFAPIGPMLMNPVSPVARKQMTAFCEAFGRQYGRYPAFAGIRFRFWDGCTAGFEPYFFDRSVGYDDFIVAAFCKDTGLKFEPVGNDPKKFNARREKLLSAKYRKTWFDWRTKICKTQIEDMLAAMRKGAPNAYFLGPETPDPGWIEPTPEELAAEKQGAIKLQHSLWRGSTGLDHETFRGHEELGFRDGFLRVSYPGCELCALDPYCFDKVNRRAAPYTNRSPERVRSQIPSFCCNGTYRVAPYQLEKPAKALAQNRLRTLWTSPEWALAPGDETLRAFVQRWRAIPDLEYARAKLPGGEFANVAVWSAPDGKGNLVVWMVNTTEYDQEVEIGLRSRAWRVVNRVDGDVLRLRKTLARKLSPFMLEVWTVEGDNAVAGAKLAVSDAEKRYIDRLFADILAMEKLAGGAVERVTSIYGAANNDYTRPFEPDRLYTYKGLVDPMKAAQKRGDYVTLGVLVRQFNRERKWWYEAFGWPEGMVCNRKIGGLSGLCYGLPYAAKRGDGLINTNEARVTALMYSTAEKYVQSDPGKPVVLRNYIRGGESFLELTALFGGQEYGDIRVETNGAYFATIPCGPGKGTREQTRVLPMPIVRHVEPPRNVPFDVAFIPEPGKRIAIRRLESIMLEPEPVTEFLVAKPKPGQQPDDPKLVWKKVTLPEGVRQLDLAPLAGPATLKPEERELYLKFDVTNPHERLGLCCFRTGRCRSQLGMGKDVRFTDDVKWEAPGYYTRYSVSTRPNFPVGKVTHVIRTRPFPEGPYYVGFGYYAGAKFKYSVPAK